MKIDLTLCRPPNLLNILFCLQEVVSEIVTSGDQLLKDNPGDDGELIPLVPVGEKMFKDVEHTALVKFYVYLERIIFLNDKNS